MATPKTEPGEVNLSKADAASIPNKNVSPSPKQRRKGERNKLQRKTERLIKRRDDLDAKLKKHGGSSTSLTRLPERLATATTELHAHEMRHMRLLSRKLAEAEISCRTDPTPRHNKDWDAVRELHGQFRTHLGPRLVEASSMDGDTTSSFGSDFHDEDENNDNNGPVGEEAHVSRELSPTSEAIQNALREITARMGAGPSPSLRDSKRKWELEVEGSSKKLRQNPEVSSQSIEEETPNKSELAGGQSTKSSKKDKKKKNKKDRKDKTDKDKQSTPKSSSKNEELHQQPAGVSQHEESRSERKKNKKGKKDKTEKAIQSPPEFEEALSSAKIANKHESKDTTARVSTSAIPLPQQQTKPSTIRSSVTSRTPIRIPIPGENSDGQPVSARQPSENTWRHGLPIFSTKDFAVDTPSPLGGTPKSWVMEGSGSRNGGTTDQASNGSNRITMTIGHIPSLNSAAADVDESPAEYASKTKKASKANRSKGDKKTAGKKNKRKSQGNDEDTTGGNATAAAAADTTFTPDSVGQSTDLVRVINPSVQALTAFSGSGNNLTRAQIEFEARQRRDNAVFEEERDQWHRALNLPRFHETKRWEQ